MQVQSIEKKRNSKLTIKEKSKIKEPDIRDEALNNLNFKPFGGISLYN